MHFAFCQVIARTITVHSQILVAINEVVGLLFFDEIFSNPLKTCFISGCKTQTGVQANRLEIEITENNIIDNLDQAIWTLAALRSKGFQLSIDDFGTQYPSLAYLKQFPLNTLKIDRSFVSDLVSDFDDVLIFTAVIRLAHGLGLRVVAKGVENAEQFAFLGRHQCDEVQSYYFSWTIPSEDFDEFLENFDIAGKTAVTN